MRVLAERGRLVYTGVATPERWESTPIYFKEITIAGSNAFGMEDFEGRRQHAIAHYLQLVNEGRLDITPMLTHRFRLEEWWPALKALARQDQSGALKVAFTPKRVTAPVLHCFWDWRGGAPLRHELYLWSALTGRRSTRSPEPQ